MAEYGVIMAGGSGTRLWPVSRRHAPKQLLTLVGERSFFQHAVDRVAGLLPPERLLVVARGELVPALSSQVPEVPMENYIIEPEGRGTAPAVGLAAVHLQVRDPGAVMVVLTADHYITKQEPFKAVLRASLDVARQGHLVTLGIEPTAPVTGYGYIEMGDSLGEVRGQRAFRVIRFTEKPDLASATAMVQSGRYVWNSGMFVWSVSRIMAEFQRQTPQLSVVLEAIGLALTEGEEAYVGALEEHWSAMPRQAIDYAVMEGAADVAVIPADIGWSDVGSWGSIYELLTTDGSGNACVGPTALLDVHDTLVYGDPSSQRLVAAVGVEGLVIVDTGDAVLVCPRSREQEVRDLVNSLRDTHRDEWL